MGQPRRRFARSSGEGLEDLIGGLHPDIRARFSFHRAIHSRMSFSRFGTLVWAPRLIFFVSTRRTTFHHVEPRARCWRECRWNLGCLSSTGECSGVCGCVIVKNQMNIETVGHFLSIRMRNS